MKKKKHKVYYCKICGKPISAGSIYCKECYDLLQRKTERPDPDTLLEKIATSSFLAVANQYGVTDSAIRKWCKAYGLPTHKKDIVKLYQEKCPFSSAD